MNWVLVKYVLTAARRDKLFLSLLAIMAIGTLISLFLSTSAVIEKEHFSVIYMAGSLRVLGLVGLVLFVVFFIRRSFEDRDVEYLLTRPVSRTSFIVSHAAGFSFLAFSVSALIGLGLTYFCAQMGLLNGALYWSIGVICEYILMCNVALFFAMVLTSPVSASMATFGLYILGRLMGQLLHIVKNPTVEMPGYELMAPVFKAVSTLIPRLDLMAQTSWLVYGTNDISNFGFIIIQAVLFLALILIAALFDLRRRQF